MSDTMKKKRMRVDQIEIPDIRITSSWAPEMLEMFRASVKTMGIQEPILVAWDDPHYWLIDGLHRLTEAKQNNKTWIEAVVVQTDMKGVHLRNLVLNRLRGKTKASEMVQVVKSLQDDHDTPLEEIVEKTGLRRDYLEELLSIGNAPEEIWAALDREEIGVGVAYQLSRIPEEGEPLKVLAQVKAFSLSAKDLKGVVDDIIELRKQYDQAPAEPQAPAMKKLQTIPCHICEEHFPVNRMRGMNVCVVCYGIIYDLAQKRKADIQAMRDLNEAALDEKMAEIQGEIPLTEPETVLDTAEGSEPSPPAEGPP